MGYLWWIFKEIFGVILFNQQGDWLICLLAMRWAAKLIGDQCMLTVGVLELLVKPHNPQGRSEWSTTWRTKMQNEYKINPALIIIWLSTFGNLYIPRLIFSTNLTKAFLDAILWCTSERGPGFLDASEKPLWTLNDLRKTTRSLTGHPTSSLPRPSLLHHTKRNTKQHMTMIDNVSVGLIALHCNDV